MCTRYSQAILYGQALPFSEPLDLALAVRQRLLRAPLAEVRVEQGGELRLYSGRAPERRGDPR